MHEEIADKKLFATYTTATVPLLPGVDKSLMQKTTGNIHNLQVALHLTSNISHKLYWQGTKLGTCTILLNKKAPGTNTPDKHL